MSFQATKGSAAKQATTAIASTTFEFAVPHGLPPDVFIPLYAAELKARLQMLLEPSGYDVRVTKENDGNCTVAAFRGTFSGMETGVYKTYSRDKTGPAMVLVQLTSSSRARNSLLKILVAPCLLLGIVLFLWRRLVGLIIMIPVVIAVGLVGAITIEILHALGGNEFTAARLIATTELIKQIPIPDPVRGTTLPGVSNLP
jgi:hypothetical protein